MMTTVYADAPEESTSPKPDIVDIIEAAARNWHPATSAGKTPPGVPSLTSNTKATQPTRTSTASHETSSSSVNSGDDAFTMSPNNLGGSFMPRSEETIVERETQAYLESIKDQKVIAPDIRDQLLSRIGKGFTREQMLRDKDTFAKHLRVNAPRSLDELTCVKVLLDRYFIAAIDFANGEGDEDLVELGIWTLPPADLNKIDRDHGLYRTGERRFSQLIRGLKPGTSEHGIKSILATLKTHAPIKEITRIPHLRAVNNGIFNHKTQALEPFTPDHVAVHKIPVNYNPDAEDPEITMPDGEKWTFNAWLKGLTEDEGVYELLWEGIAAVAWPYFKRSKALFLHSDKGLNGKGTYCRLLENILGPRGSTAIPLTKFGDEYALTNLLRAQAIITHENSVGTFSDDLKDFKSVATADKFTMNRKFKDPMDAVFVGPIFQCVNDFPKTRDKSNSIARRQLWIPFPKSFEGDGLERGYIKDDYLGRHEVLEYVLKEALHMPLAKFSEPQACLDLLETAKRENNAVREFWFELEDQFVWDLLPTSFLYDLFIAWFKKNHPSGIPVSKSTFTNQLLDILSTSDLWDFKDKNKKHRPGQKFVLPEPLIAEYDLKDWFNTGYSGNDHVRKSGFVPTKANYMGVQRLKPAPSVKDPDTDTAG